MSTIAKFLSKPPDGFSTQISTASVSATDLSVALDSASGLPTEGVGQFFKKDANGEVIPGSVEFCHWTNVSGNTITFSDTGDRGITGSDSGAQAYVADDYFEVWVSSYYFDGKTVEHNGDGTHKSALVTTLKASGADVTTGTSDTKIVTPKALADAGIAAASVTASSSTTFTNKTISIESNVITLPSASVYASGNVTVADDAAVTFDSEAWDTNTFHDTGSNTSRLTVPSDGKYLVTANIQFGAGNDKYIYLKVNGSVVQYGSRHTGTGQTISALLNMTATQYVEVFILDSAGGTSNTVVGGATQSTFSIIKLSD